MQFRSDISDSFVPGARQRNRCRAFSLVELLIVIAVVAVLAGILLPVLRSAQDQAMKTDDLARLRQLGMARAIYYSDYDANVYRCAPLVSQGLVPAVLCVSKSDFTPKGVANEMLQQLSNQIQRYGTEVTAYPLSYLGSGDIFPPGPILDRINRQPSAGWLANLVRVQDDPNQHDMPGTGKGQYQRLLLDGAVITKTVSHYSAKWKHGTLTGSSPVLLYCDPDDTWMQDIKTPPHS